MATYTVGSGGDYASLATMAASGVLANSDTIQLQPGYDIDEQVVFSALDSITVVGDVASPASMKVKFSNPSGVAGAKVWSQTNCVGWTYKGFTLEYSGAYSASTAAWHGGYGTTGSHLFEDLILDVKSHYGGVNFGDSSTWRRCKFDGTANTGGNSQTQAAWGGGASNVFESCLFLNFSLYGIEGGTDAVIKNCTFYNNNAAADNMSGVAGAQFGGGAEIYNTICYMETVTGTTDKGIALTSAAFSSVSNSILYGSYWGDTSDLFQTGGSATTTNVTLSSGIGGNAVMVDAAAGDYYPAIAGLALETGDATYAPALDITGLPFDSPPSMGAYERVQTNCSLDYSGGGSASNRAGAFIKASKLFTRSSPEYGDDWSDCVVSPNGANGNPGWKITAESMGHIIAGYPYRFQFMLDNGTASDAFPGLYVKLRNTAKAVPLNIALADLAITVTRVWSIDLGGGIALSNGMNVQACSLITDIEVFYLVYNLSSGAPPMGAAAELSVTSTFPRRT